MIKTGPHPLNIMVYIMIKKLEKKIPALPGVYLFKDKDDVVIYIGKAKSLKLRVHSYFQKQKTDWKVNTLLEEYADVDYIVTKNETEASLLEAQLIKQYQPKFNVLLKSGQPFLYILFTNQEFPRIKLVRNKKEKGAYFGPFLEKMKARKVYNFLLKTFRLNVCNKKIEHGCLDYHIDNCAGSCKPDFDAAEYIFRLGLTMDVLKNKHNDFINKIEKKISEYNQQFAFEKAKHLHEYLDNLDAIFHTIGTHYSPQKFADEIFVATTPKPVTTTGNLDLAQKIKDFLHLDGLVHTIDCFDVSHFQSRYLVGSCVRFTDGIPDKNKFRRFSIKTLEQQNDYAALQEIVQRRYKDPDELPDLIIIDGGKGQLNAVQAVLPKAHCGSLAKKEERLYSKHFPGGIQLDVKTDVGKLIIALRDYAHHFAISYHRLRRSKEIKPFVKSRPNYKMNTHSASKDT